MGGYSPFVSNEEPADLRGDYGGRQRYRPTTDEDGEEQDARRAAAELFQQMEAITSENASLKKELELATDIIRSLRGENADLAAKLVEAESRSQAGAIMSAARYRPHDVLPAGGVGGAAVVARYPPSLTHPSRPAPTRRSSSLAVAAASNLPTPALRSSSPSYIIPPSTAYSVSEGPTPSILNTILRPGPDLSRLEVFAGGYRSSNPGPSERAVARHTSALTLPSTAAPESPPSIRPVDPSAAPLSNSLILAGRRRSQPPQPYGWGGGEDDGRQQSGRVGGGLQGGSPLSLTDRRTFGGGTSPYAAILRAEPPKFDFEDKPGDTARTHSATSLLSAIRGASSVSQ